MPESCHVSDTLHVHILQFCSVMILMILMITCITLRLQLIAGTNFSVFALRVLAYTNFSDFEVLLY